MPQDVEKQIANNYTVTELFVVKDRHFFQAKTLIAKLFNVEMH